MRHGLFFIFAATALASGIAQAEGTVESRDASGDLSPQVETDTSYEDRNIRHTHGINRISAAPPATPMTPYSAHNRRQENTDHMADELTRMYNTPELVRARGEAYQELMEDYYYETGYRDPNAY